MAGSHPENLTKTALSLPCGGCGGSLQAAGALPLPRDTSEAALRKLASQPLRKLNLDSVGLVQNFHGSKSHTPSERDPIQPLKSVLKWG